MSVTVELPAEWGRDYLFKMIDFYIKRIYAEKIEEETRVVVLPDEVSTWLDTFCPGRYKVNINYCPYPD